MKKFIGLLVWTNPYGKLVCQLLEDWDDETEYTLYFENKEDIRNCINPSFPARVLCVNLETLETEEL